MFAEAEAEETYFKAEAEESATERTERGGCTLFPSVFSVTSVANIPEF